MTQAPDRITPISSDIHNPSFAPLLDECAFLLDIDGTLLDLAPTPSEVVVPPGLAEALSALHMRTDGALALVSGRSLADIDRIYWLKGDPHWNQAGSDLFAAAMAAYLREHIARFQSHDVAQSH